MSLWHVKGKLYMLPHIMKRKSRIGIMHDEVGRTHSTHQRDEDCKQCFGKPPPGRPMGNTIEMAVKEIRFELD